MNCELWRRHVDLLRLIDKGISISCLKIFPGRSRRATARAAPRPPSEQPVMRTVLLGIAICVARRGREKCRKLREIDVEAFEVVK